MPEPKKDKSMPDLRRAKRGRTAPSGGKSGGKGKVPQKNLRS